MDGTHGFRVDDGAYENYARGIDPLGEQVRGAAAKHVGPHTDIAGDGFSAMGGEAGFTAAYGDRMRRLHQRVGSLGGSWGQMHDASLRTSANYQAVESDQQDHLSRVTRGLRS